MPLFVPATTAELVASYITPDTSVEIAAGQACIITNKLALTSSVIISLDSGAILRIL